MNYKLAKQLKDAGFSFNDYVPVLGKDINGNPIEIEEYVVDRFPTLEELIDACGDGFLSLTHCQEGWYAETGGVKTSLFKDPSEAVAKLFIKLNKYEL